MAERYIELIDGGTAVHPDDLDLIGRHLAPGPGVVLDLGCGPGHLTAHLRSIGVHATGVDLVPEFVDHARSTHPDGRYLLGSIDRLPVPDGVATGILAWYSLIHLPPDRVDDVLAGLRRATVPGGRLVVGFFDGDAVEPFDHKVVTAHRWPVDELAARLDRAGFAEVERQQRPADPAAAIRPHAALAAVAR